MVATKLFTSKELFEMGPDAGRFELVRGELREMSPAGGNHGALQMWLGSCLGAAVYPNRLGAIFSSDTGFDFLPGGNTVLAPDVSFIANGRLPRGKIWEGFVPIAPDLAVEIFSPSNTEADMLDIIGLYFLGGCRLVWLIRPKHRTVTVFQPNEPEFILRDGDVLSGAPILPEFKLEIASLFGELET